MKKFGFGKKPEEAADDSSRNALFGSRSSKPKAPATNNPYAVDAARPDPYAQGGSSYGGMAPPPAYDGAMNDYRRDKSPVPPGGYGSSTGGGYGASSGYENQGYGGGGSNRYGTGAGPESGGSAPRRGPGGYGGLGRSNSQENMSTDAGREALFGNAPQRSKQPQGLPPGPNGQPRGGQGGAPGGYGSGYGEQGQGQGQGQGYGAYGDRQLTAEEEEEEDVSAAKQEIRFMKQQDVSSTRNALRLAAQAEETGMSTLNRLGAQGERIHNTERNLDLAANQNRLAEEKARELKTVNRSMFAVHVGNPFTAKSRREARDQAIMDKHREERDVRDATREAAFRSQTRQAEYQQNVRGTAGPKSKASLAERAKYQFEADSEDEGMENEIDSNLDALHGAAGRLNKLAGAMGKEVDEQNKHIDRITAKVSPIVSPYPYLWISHLETCSLCSQTDKVDDQIAMNSARLGRIR